MYAENRATHKTLITLNSSLATSLNLADNAPTLVGATQKVLSQNKLTKLIHQQNF